MNSKFQNIFREIGPGIHDMLQFIYFFYRKKEEWAYFYKEFLSCSHNDQELIVVDLPIFIRICFLDHWFNLRIVHI